MPREPDRQAHLRIPAQHRAGPKNRERKVRRRCHLAPLVTSRYTWKSADRVPGGVYDGGADGDGSDAR